MASECTQAELPPVFQTVEHALDDVARFIEFGVIVEQHFAVLARWDAGDCFGLAQPIAQVMSVITTISDDRASFGDIGLKALTCLCNIRPIACRQV